MYHCINVLFSLYLVLKQNHKMKFYFESSFNLRYQGTLDYCCLLIEEM